MFFRTAQLPVVKRTVREIQSITQTHRVRGHATGPRELARDSNVSLEPSIRQRFATISKNISARVAGGKQNQRISDGRGLFAEKRHRDQKVPKRLKVLTPGDLRRNPASKMDFSEIFFEPPTLGVRRTGIEQDEPPSLCARATILGWLVGRHWFWVHFRVAGFRSTRGG